MKILIFDNYDSFTYNLVHLVKKVSDCEIEVHRNDKISLDEINRFDRIIISPGPGIPSEAGILLDVLKKYASMKPILGVCLGHQAIAESFGGTLYNLENVYHGVSTLTRVLGKDVLFKNITGEFNVGRYHSWAVDTKTLPDCLEVTATDDNDIIMAMRHKEYNVRSVQFHPESILTEHGEILIKNWIEA
jgi:anthranilate synthase component II